VDPDDGPFVMPPIELVFGRSNVMTYCFIPATALIVVIASWFFFSDDMLLHFTVVAAVHVVTSHLPLCQYWFEVLCIPYIEPPVFILIELSENP
jgi:hypothetical protein